MQQQLNVRLLLWMTMGLKPATNPGSGSIQQLVTQPLKRLKINIQSMSGFSVRWVDEGKRDSSSDLLMCSSISWTETRMIQQASTDAESATTMHTNQRFCHFSGIWHRVHAGIVCHHRWICCVTLISGTSSAAEGRTQLQQEHRCGLTAGQQAGLIT